ncbi:sulfoxide reductase heme-binding subunit YedZ [Rhodobacteraceae bacterium EhC02]|nr:protein-methionine-sulfoxide reductase heme-binding subunit MsrQ [Paracoccaceae bacterium]OAN71977.1 sulfoxide reductase heme-binding subunit YedZ [Rhodobacteraceae bacterium EhC02]
MLADQVNTAVRRIPVWLVYTLGLLPAPWFLYLGLTGGLGVEPIKALEHELGLLALQIMVAGLCITPLRRYAGLNLLRFRRALGILCFTYVALHLLVWLVLDVQTLERVWADVVKRPYITIGMTAFVLLIPLALTSNDLSVRRLGPLWRRLHKLTYVAVPLGAIHFVMLRKGFQLEPLVYLLAIAVLLALRLPVLARPRRTSRA